MNKAVLGVGVLATAPLLGLLFMSGDRDPRNVPSPLISKPAPNVLLHSLDDGAALQLATLKGKPVVVNFWASWCLPCIQEHQALTAAARENPDVAFIGVIYEDTPENARNFLTQRGRSYASYLDGDGKAAIAFGLSGVPESFFIDAAGNVTSKFVGALDTDSIREKLAEARR